MNFNEFERELKNKAEKINIRIETEVAEKFFKYMKLLIEWNKKINLTAITEERDIITKHFIDSLEIAKYIKKGDKVADIGTGAGFPGIPLKILYEDLDIDLVDSLNKRITFLEEVVDQLELSKIETIHSRVEDLARDPKKREKYDVVVSRAVAPLNILLEYMLPLVDVGKMCICMKGMNIQKEIDQSENALKILGGRIRKIEKLKLPETDMERNIILIEKIKNTPKKYPRKPGKAVREPIN